MVRIWGWVGFELGWLHVRIAKMPVMPPILFSPSGFVLMLSKLAENGVRIRLIKRETSKSKEIFEKKTTIILRFDLNSTRFPNGGATVPD